MSSSIEMVHSSMLVKGVHHRLSGSKTVSLRRSVARQPCVPRSRQVVVASSNGNTAKGLGAAVTGLAASPLAANANTARDLALELQEKIDDASPYVGQAAKTAGTVAGVAKDALGQAYTAARPGLEAAAPVVKKAAERLGGAAVKVGEAGVTAATSELKSVGVDLSGAEKVGSAASGVASKGLPFVNGLVEKVTTADETTLATGLAAVGLAALLYPIFGPAAAKQIRGYTGDITAPAALDLLVQGDALLIDIRDEADLIDAGSPSLPRAAAKALVEIPVATLSDKQLRNRMKNPGALEAEATAVIISSLKKVKKNTNIILIDKNGKDAVQVARSLAAMGWSSNVILGGFSGRGGWVDSSLGTTGGVSSQSFFSR